MTTPLPRREAGSARRAPLLYAFAANALTPANAPTPATPHIFCTAPTSATAAWAIRVIPAQSWALTSL